MTFSTLTRLTNALQATVANDSDVHNVFINPVNASALVATTAALPGRFRQRPKTAQTIARADHLQLGQAISVTEGKMRLPMAPATPWANVIPSPWEILHNPDLTRNC